MPVRYVEPRLCSARTTGPTQNGAEAWRPLPSSGCGRRCVMPTVRGAIGRPCRRLNEIDHWWSVSFKTFRSAHR